jgi:hypothetical protein
MTVFLVLRVVRRSAEGADIAILAGPLTEAPSSSRVSFDDAVDDPAEFLDCCAVPRQENARPVDLPFLELPMDCRAGVELRRVVLRMGRTCRALGLQVVHPGFPI